MADMSGLINGANLVGGLIKQGRDTQDYIDAMFNQHAKKRAGQAYATGDYQGASGILASRGMTNEADAMFKAGQGRADDAASRDALLKYSTGDLSGAATGFAKAGDGKSFDAVENEGVRRFKAQHDFIRQAAPVFDHIAQQKGDVSAAFESIVPDLQQLKVPDAEIERYRQAFKEHPTETVAMLKAGAAKKYEFRSAGDETQVFDTETGELMGRYVGTRFIPVAAGGSLVQTGGVEGEVANEVAGGAAPTGAPAATPGTSAPRNLRNNNPGNIEDGDFAKSLPGYKGSDGRFAIFETPEAGTVAQTQLLQSYGRRGFDTVEEIIHRWAPPSDNNPTGAYVNFVAGKMGVKPGEQLDMKDPATLQKLAVAIKQFEGGPQSASNPASAAPGKAQGGVRVVAQGQEKPQARTLAPDEAEKRGFLPGTIVQERADGTLHTIQTPNSGGTPRKAEADLRKEFNGRPEVKAFREVENAYKNIQSAAKNPTAAGDISMLFAYMKLLDPDSVVREGEFATAQNATGIPERILNAYNKALKGTRLNANQRVDFINQAGSVFQNRKARFDTVTNEFRGYAEDYGVNPDRVATTSPAEATKPAAKDSGLTAPQQSAAARFQGKGAKAGTANNPYTPRTEAEYRGTPKGAFYIHPDGSIRQKVK